MTARESWRAAIRRDRARNGPWPRPGGDPVHANDNCFGAARAARNNTERAAAAGDLVSLPSRSAAASPRARPPVSNCRYSVWSEGRARFLSRLVVQAPAFLGDLAALVFVLIVAAAAVLLPYAYAGGPQ